MHLTLPAWPATPPRQIVWRILLPVIALLSAILTAVIFLVYSAEQQQLEHSLNDLDTNIRTSYQELLHEHRHKLAALAQIITSNAAIVADMKKRNADSLYSDSIGLFRSMQQKYKITHLYYHDSNRINLLRMHDPAQKGDRIDRLTAILAEKQGEAVSDVELGPLGTLTLRRVEPLRVKGELLGYIEIGEELAPIIADLKHLARSDIYVVIDKQYLDQAGWQEGQKMLGRHGEWQQLATHVFSAQTAESAPAPLIEALGNNENSFPLKNFDYASAEGRFRTFSQPIYDSSGREIGHLVIAKNIDPLVGRLWQRVIIVSTLAIFISLLLCVIFYRLLRSVEQELQAQDKALAVETKALQKSTIMLTRAQRLAGLTSWEWNIADDQIAWGGNAGDFFGTNHLPVSLDGWLASIHADDRAPFRHHLHEALHQHHELRHEQRLLQPDGNTIPVVVSGTGQYDEHGVLQQVTGFMLNVTTERTLENEFFKAQKMGALGILVGGIAHDFNNLLMGILGNAHLAKRHCDDPVATQKLARIEALGHEAVQSIASLLAFARHDGTEMKRFTFTSFIKEIHKMLRFSLPENISLRLDYSHEPMPVVGDAAQIHQMLLNVVCNAQQALESVDTPLISIDVHPWQADADFHERYPDLAFDRFVLLSVHDNGCGISEEEQQRIFEPFFTTKEQCCGLGLAMVQGGMHRHEGVAEVESQPGEGTTFRLYFPLQEEARKSASAAGAPSEESGPLTLLVVDDRQAVCETTAEMLTEAGHRVLTANDGKMAIDCFYEHADTIDLVLTDVVMPVMDGVAAIGKIRSLVPDMPCIFMTGYDEDTLKHHKLPPNSRLLSKPFTVEQLQQLIAELHISKQLV